MIRRPTPSSCALAVAACIVISSVVAAPAAADFMVVTSTVDEPDRNLAELACWTGTACTLRAAIQTANASPGPDTIILYPGVHTITIPGANENASLTGDFDIASDLTIMGCGMSADCDPSTTVVEAGPVAKGGLDRVFHIAADVHVTFRGITIRNGNASASARKAGGGIDFEPFTSAASLTLDNVIVEQNTVSGTGVVTRGGGVYATRQWWSPTAPTVTITGSVIRDNEAVLGTGGGVCLENAAGTIVDSTFSGNVNVNSGGGAISAMGPEMSLVIDRCLITGNASVYPGSGAGVFLMQGSTAISNTTIAGNHTDYDAGGILNQVYQPTNLTLRNVTIVGNAGSAISDSASRATIHNSIVSGPIYALFAASSSNNILSSAAGLTDGVNGNRIGVDPRLSPLENHGGRSAAYFPLSGSPALDAGNNTEAQTYDQRGFQRIVDSADADSTATVDIGAVEVFPTVSDIPDQTANIATPLPVPFHVGDAALGLTIFATSDNGAVVPAGGLAITGGTTAGPTLVVTASGAGVANVTITVSYGGLTSSDVFKVTVLPPDLAITKSHAGEFAQGGVGTYTITVSNVGTGASGGMVTVVDTLPASLTPVSLSGDGWTCDAPAATCSRPDGLAAGSTYPPITLVTQVGGAAPPSVTNQAGVSGPGDANSSNDIAFDSTTILPRVATTTTINAPTIAYGAAASVTVAVASPEGSPSGDVTLSVDGGAPITAVLSAGVASFSVPSLSAGIHTLAALYLGDSGNQPSVGSGSVTVDPATTALSISAPSVSYGQSATVAVTASAPGVTPVGDVTLIVDAVSQTKPLVGGVATFTVSSLVAGTYPLDASLAATTSFLASTATGSLVVDRATTSLTVVSSAITFGETATVTVSITSPTPEPAGAISLSVDGGAPVDRPIAGGVATFTLTGLAGGERQLVAAFAGDANYQESGASSTLRVDAAATKLAIAAPAIVYGNDATVTVTASSAAGAPTGDVTLAVDGGAPVTRALAGGVATFVVASQAGGEHALKAEFAGNPNFAASSSDATLRVDPAATTLTITAPSIGYGSNGLVTITLSSSAGTPAGGVSLTIDGGAPVTLPLVVGTASHTLPTPATGDHTLVAAYDGSASFGPSSASSVLTVSRAETRITITGTRPEPSAPGEFVAVGFSLRAGSGTVTVSAGAASCTAPIAAGKCSLVLVALGSVSVVAAYGGDSNYLPATSAPYVHRVAWPAATAVVSGDSAVCSGGSVTIGVALTGTAPWKLTWSDGVVETAWSASHERVVTVSDSSSFSLTALADAHGNGTSTGSANVTVSRAPEAPIITGPESAAPGEQFALVASGGFERYQWNLNGGEIAGATSQTLRIGAATDADFGAYTVIGYSSACPSAPSAPFVVGQANWLIAAIVGSADGANGARFRSSMHLFNRGGVPFSGQLSFVAAGAPESAADASIGLLPFESRWWGDLLGSAGGAVLASADLQVSEGLLPLGLIHVYNDAGGSGTTGLLQPLLDARRALRRGEHAVIIAPANPLTTRLNIGVRTLGEGASMRVTLRSASGDVRATVDRDYPATHFAQMTAAAFLGVAPDASDSMRIELIAGAAIVYGASTDNRTNDPSIQVAQRLGDGSEVRRIVPVVGSVGGAYGSRFRTSVQLHNASDRARDARFILHPQGAAKTFTIEPGATFAIADLLPALGLEGLATADLVSSSAVVPFIRVYNDGEGETSMTEDLVDEADVLHAGTTATLIAPHDIAAARFNIGVRTLEEGARLRVTVRSPLGLVVAEKELDLQPTWFQQTTADGVTGHAFTGDESVTWEVMAGRAVIYGVWTDNTTQDPSFQYAH